VAGLAESNTGEPGAVISRMPGSVGGRRKRVRTRGYLAGGLPCGSSRSTADVHGRSGGCVGEYRRSGGRPLRAEQRVLKIQTSLYQEICQTHLGTYGEPVAVKVARRVREAVRGNGPVERPEPRPGPTSQRTAAPSSAATAPTMSRTVRRGVSDTGGSGVDRCPVV
jgi:hypothetical protein